MSEIGIVDSVTVDRDDKRVLVTVLLTAGRTERDIPFVTPMQGMWIVPEIDQYVEVYEAATSRKKARFPHTVPEHDMPSGLGPGDFAVTLNSGTSLSFLQQSDGTYNIDVNADGDINLSANGDIVIDEGGTPKPVLTEDAVFEYEQRVDTGDGTGGTVTKETTKVSNTEITKTEIE